MTSLLATLSARLSTLALQSTSRRPSPRSDFRGLALANPARGVLTVALALFAALCAACSRALD